MPLANRELQIVNKAATGDTITTTPLKTDGGYLQPFQAKQFIEQTWDQAALLSKVRHEQHTEKSGTMTKIGVGSRLSRKKTENVDNGVLAGIHTSTIEYETVALRMDWDVTNETLRENIQGQSLASLITSMMSKQLANDMEDLALNGDEDIASTDPSHDFLYVNDGWVKLIRENGNVTDATDASGYLVDIVDAAADSIKDKYHQTQSLAWIMHPQMARTWRRHLRDWAITQGGIVDASLYNMPAGLPIIETVFMPGDTVLLTAPQNLIVVSTYSVNILEDSTSVLAIRQDKRFYVTHYDIDMIVQEYEATGIITGIDPDNFKVIKYRDKEPVEPETDPEEPKGPGEQS